MSREQPGRVLFQYPIRCLIIRSREISKLWDWQFKLSHRFEFDRHVACLILERSDNSKYNSRSSETKGDLTIKRLIRYWNGAQKARLMEHNTVAWQNRSNAWQLWTKKHCTVCYWWWSSWCGGTSDVKKKNQFLMKNSICFCHGLFQAYRNYIWNVSHCSKTLAQAEVFNWEDCYWFHINWLDRNLVIYEMPEFHS